MVLRKISLLALSALSIFFTAILHPLFILAVLFFLILLFNWTDFFYREDPRYSQTDLSRLMDGEAGPIELDNSSDKAVIFVHGFPSTPKTYKYVAPIAADSGYDVFAPLLPGFGTNHDDFIKSNFSQWYAYLSDYYLEKRRKYKKLYIIGLSMGGALTLKLAEEFSGTEWAPDGISVNAAPVSLRFPRKGPGRGASLLFIRTLGWFVRHQGGKSDKWKKMEDGHNEWLGYQGQFPRQVYSLKMAVYKIRKDLSKISVPVIAFQAPDDSTVDFTNLSLIENGVSSKIKSFNRLDYTGYYNTSHALFLYESIREKLIRHILDFFEGLE
ncbi:alpha/beta hydrolase [Spirochaeta isovalerica]|uniref:Carboxylesterase n=1 Tax=Spirochaeta isovalerica TaxID=150 RepID=A0A841RB47_9SPIO|nr:alpha/beta fold hydrolase [Spirochaeta isovalerica]MBB6481153.1 carboxylesterase [Spirochaeta isovalerica]